MAFGSDETSHSRVEKGRYTLGDSMLAMIEPVLSRSAAIISLLEKQNPVSSVAVIVPAKARLNSETFNTTFRLTSLAL